MNRSIVTLLLGLTALTILAIGPASASVPKVVLVAKHGATW